MRNLFEKSPIFCSKGLSVVHDVSNPPVGLRLEERMEFIIYCFDGSRMMTGTKLSFVVKSSERVSAGICRYICDVPKEYTKWRFPVIHPPQLGGEL